jgi:hypothetical protein
MATPTRDALTLPPTSSLPDPFAFENGRRIQHPSEWPARRRELRALLERYEFGPYPPPASRIEGALSPERDRLTVAVRVDR